MQKRAFEIKPIDIRAIRQGLNLSQEQMGDRIALLSKDVGNDTFVPSRISEWENGHRSVPGYVYHAVAYVLLSEWSGDRHSVDRDMVADVDEFYGSLLSAPFGELLCVEHALSNSRKAADRATLIDVRKTRRAQQRYLEQVLDVRMGFVFAAEPGGYDEDAEGEVL